ncbi:MAG TPA: phosphatidate cytidylyltransferase [Candidatus Angelobacter sp.]|nr:phosphatidate cytidylyltransferase [Candidatus Angelobacter sp.]
MKRVLTAVALIPVVLLLVFKAPLWLYALVIAAIIVITLREYLDIAKAAGVKPFRCLSYVAALLPIGFLLYVIVAAAFLGHARHYWFYSPENALMTTWRNLALLAPVIFGIPLVFRKDLSGGLSSSAVSAFGVFYIGASLSTLVVLRSVASQAILVIFVLFSVWAGDIAAYYIGKNFGRHKLAPIVSPNKSWEGAIASVVASVGMAFLVLHYRHDLNEWFSPSGSFRFDFGTSYIPIGTIKPVHVIALGVLTNIAAQFGDLFESALKRGAGVKDSGTLLPGHGGMLDRIDALLFAVPVVWYYANLTRFLLP